MKIFIEHWLVKVAVYVTSICVVSTFADKATFLSAPIIGVLVNWDATLSAIEKVARRKT
jgi:hypothetical protein